MQKEINIRREDSSEAFQSNGKAGKCETDVDSVRIDRTAVREKLARETLAPVKQGKKWQWESGRETRGSLGEEGGGGHKVWVGELVKHVLRRTDRPVQCSYLTREVA